MNTNLQYRRTDKAIVNALCTLCLAEPFEKITVKEILDEALVSRNTFYAHYKDKYEIAEKLFAEFIHEFQDMITRIYKSGPNCIYKLPQPERDKEISDIYHNFNNKNSTLIKVLFRIQTKEINIQETFRHYFAQHYANDPDVHSQGEQRMAEARVYAAIQSAFIGVNSSQNNLSVPQSAEEIASNVIYASLYAVGIRDTNDVNELYQAIMAKREAAFALEVL